MTVVYQLNNMDNTSYSSNWYITDVAVPAQVGSDPYTNVNLRDPGSAIPTNATPLVVTSASTSTTNPDLVSYTSGGQTTTVTLQSLLTSNTYPIIELASGTYYLDQPLLITYGKILQGQNSGAVLDFAMTSVAQGAINFNASHTTLNNFTIEFSHSAVAFTDANQSNAAVISDEEGQPWSRVDLNVTNLTIDAPQTTNFLPNSDYGGQILTVNSIYMDNFDSGTIENNTIYGGTASVQFGPWQITGNKV